MFEIEQTFAKPIQPKLYSHADTMRPRQGDQTIADTRGQGVKNAEILREIEPNLYSPHTVAKFNENSNQNNEKKTKGKYTMAMQFQY